MFLESIPVINELNEISILLRCLLSMFLGGIIGVERTAKRRPAGFRTYIIVCVGSALIMMTNQFIHITTGTPDSTRIVAQVISGIGFLGAGTILVTKNNQVKGLTTAAGLWACAALGIAIGCGFYTGAIAGFLSIFCSVQVLHAIDGRIYKRSRIIPIYIELSSPRKIKYLLSFAKSHDMELGDFEWLKQGQSVENTVSVVTTIHIKERTNHENIIAELAQLNGINFVEELN